MASLRGKQLKQVIDPALAKAFTHPLRGHIWVTLCERGTASPKEIADELGIDVSEVSYHFRGLRKRKLIELVRTERRRGFAEHFYEPCARSRHLSQTWLLVDEQGWEESMLVMREALDRVQAIQTASAERRGESGHPGIPISVVLAAFETAAGASQREQR